MVLVVAFLYQGSKSLPGDPPLPSGAHLAVAIPVRGRILLDHMQSPPNTRTEPHAICERTRS